MELSHLLLQDREVYYMAEEKTDIKEELEKMEYEPILPVEKKLIVWSLGLGAILLGILVWISYTLFPATP